MAQLVFGGGTSHSPMLNCTEEDWPRHIERDPDLAFIGREGNPVGYAEVLAAADPKIAREYMHPESFRARYAASQSALDRLAQGIGHARLDALLIVGDDQQEMFREHNMPAFSVYWGATIRNGRAADKPMRQPPWFGEALRKYFEPEAVRDYPVAQPLAKHLIASLMRAEFDISTSACLTDGQSEGHAVGFVHRRLLGASPVPVIPVLINTYYPPNQPSAARCFKFGAALAAAVDSFAGDARVGILASGGLSHFTVEEARDRALIAALESRDAAALCALRDADLQSGHSEVRNWVCVAGAMGPRPMDWLEYIPGYRTPAGTGIGLCFAQWQAG